jgi:hypothetical protein
MDIIDSLMACFLCRTYAYGLNLELIVHHNEPN